MFVNDERDICNERAISGIGFFFLVVFFWVGCAKKGFLIVFWMRERWVPTLS